MIGRVAAHSICAVAVYRIGTDNHAAPDLSLALLILADRAGKSAPGLARWEEFGLALLWIGYLHGME